ncbi:hypothetical protein ACROYT_G009455 [Oculina patagonica]
MSNTLYDAFWLCFVSMLWGSTNPLIRKGSKGIEDIHRSGRIRQFLAEIFFLASNWKYLIPFLLNQCGSVVYYLTLASVDLSIAVPITNSLTMIITTLTGKLLGEGNINAGTFIGMSLVICGVTICVIDKAAV